MEGDILKIQIGPQGSTLYTPPKVLPIISEYDERLYQVSNPIEKVDKYFIECLKATLKELNGFGLSAVQVGVLDKIFVLYAENRFFEYINPKILDVDKEKTAIMEEGCISFPFLFVKVKRPTWVNLEWFDSNMNRHEQIYHGMTARVILHEMDHLDGITIKQRVTSLEYRLADQRRLKEKKKLLRGK